MAEHWESTVRRANLIMGFERLGSPTDLTKQVESFSYTDNLDGEADSLEVTLEDFEGRWKWDWYPVEGDKVYGHLLCQNWDRLGNLPLIDFGVLTIDDVEPSGPPDKVTVRAVSTPITSTLKKQPRSRLFEGLTLKKIFQQIAGEQGLGLDWKTTGFQDKPRDIVAQNKESPWAFLTRLAKENGLTVKVAEQKLIVQYGVSLEQQDPILTIKLGEARLLRYRFHSSALNVYKACQVLYHDPVDNQTHTHTFEPQNPPKVGPILKISERVASKDEAKKLAQAKLREKNLQQHPGSLVFEGNPSLKAGEILTVEGHGKHDDNYLITRATHRLSGSSAYETEVSIKRKVGF